MEVPLPGNLRWFLLYPHSVSGTVQDPPCKTAVASWLFCNSKCGLWLSSLNSSAKGHQLKQEIKGIIYTFILYDVFWQEDPQFNYKYKGEETSLSACFKPTA